MLGDGGSRGACLEMTLTKLCIVSPNCRIVGMSATLSNIQDITKFLNAQLYTNNFRPVKLIEYVKIGDHIYEIDKCKFHSPDQDVTDCLVHKRITNFQYTKKLLARDPDQLIGLVAETLLGQSINDWKGFDKTFYSSFNYNSSGLDRAYSCLVFCPTKLHCENTARMLADLLPAQACNPMNQTDLLQRRHSLLTDLHQDNLSDIDITKQVGDDKSFNCCPILRHTIPRGVAYHHSGLTQEERTTLEVAYSEGVISVLCCTSTLAAGVNLPARRVIIRKPLVGNAFISSTQYQQMTGRAGRAGLDTVGESVTILQPSDQLAFGQMLTKIVQFHNNTNMVSNSAQVNTTNEFNTNNSTSIHQPVNDNHTVGLCFSSLSHDNNKGLRHFLLSLIGLEIAATYSAILSAFEKTLFAIQSCGSDTNLNSLRTIVRTELRELIKMNLIVPKSGDTVLLEKSPLINSNKKLDQMMFQATKMGRASIAGNIDTDYIGPLMSDLRLAAKAINTSGPLHLLYLVAPPEIVDTIHIDWNVLFDRVNQLSSNESNLITLLGFPEGYILWKATGQPIRRKLDERPLRRLYVALALAELWQNRSTSSIWYIAERYKLTRGSLQSILASSSSVASSLAYALSNEFSTDTELWAFAHLLPEFATRLGYCVSTELLPLMELPGVKRTRARQLYNVGYRNLKDIACANVNELTKYLAPYLSKRVANEIIQAAQMIISGRANALCQEASEMMYGLPIKSVQSQMAEILKFKPFSPQFIEHSKPISDLTPSNIFTDEEDLFS